MCSAAEALFTFTAASAELRLPVMEARPVGGGRIRAAAAIAVDPAAEADPRALQAEFSGRGLDPALAQGYAPALRNAGHLRDTVGRVSLRGSAVGSHAAPVIRAAVDAPHCGSQAVLVLERERAAGSLRAPALLASGTVLTEFPPFEEQKLALTQADATAMAQPRVTGAGPAASPPWHDRSLCMMDMHGEMWRGTQAVRECGSGTAYCYRRACRRFWPAELSWAPRCDVGDSWMDGRVDDSVLHGGRAALRTVQVGICVGDSAGVSVCTRAGARGLVDVRGMDLQPFMQALEDPPAAPALAPPAAGGDAGGVTAAAMPARLRGQLKLWMNERAAEEAGDGSEPAREGGGGEGASYEGSMELQGLRVNQMQLAHGLKGDFALADGRFQLDADGFWAYEKLRMDLNFAGLAMLERLASLEGLLGEAGLAASGGRVVDGPADQMLLDRQRQRAGGSSVELQHGNMTVCAAVDSAMEQVCCVLCAVACRVDEAGAVGVFQGVAGVQVEVKADGVPLDKLNIGGVKGTLRNVDVSANLRTREARAALDVRKPHLQVCLRLTVPPRCGGPPRPQRPPGAGHQPPPPASPPWVRMCML